MKRRIERREGTEGIALVAALLLLVVFWLMGAAYLRATLIEVDRGRDETRQLRAQYAADGGVNVAIGQIEAALRANTVTDLIDQSPLALEMPVYMYEAQEGLVVDPDYRVEVSVAVSDECARLDLNQAPTSVLRAVLNIDGTRARDIRAGLPRAEGDASTGGGPRAWFTSVDDLVARRLLTPTEFDALDTELLTVYTMSDPGSPGRYLNLNSAPPRILAAVLDVPPETAQQVAAARPFANLDELVAAAGKDPAAFAVRPDPNVPGALPQGLGFGSDCYRIRSEASFVGSNGQRAVSARTEAVVVFVPGGKPVITYWSAANPQTEPQEEGTPQAGDAA